ncbi:MAG: nitrous oxide reductase family maturation protein NosD [Phycisphaerae bacterium]
MPKKDHPYRPSWPGSDIYVSPRGGEKYSGLRADPNGRDSDGPLPSLPWALARLAESPPVGPVTIWLDEGTYFLDEPLVLGTDAPLVTLAARPGAKVTLSGGKRITGFTESTDEEGRRVWTADLPEVTDGQWYFRSLYVNGVSRPRTRRPEEGLMRIDRVPGMTFDSFIGPPESHHKTFYCKPEQVQPWWNLGDVDAVAVHYWLEERLPLEHVDPSTGRIDTQVLPWFPLKDDAAARCARVWFENVPGELNKPGQWYLDRPLGQLTYLPREDEQLDATEVIAPVLDHLIRIEGSPETPVRGIVLRDLQIAHADWSHIPGRGTDSQAAISVPGIVRMKHARQCAIDNCRIGPAGPYGIEVGVGCRGNRISGCSLTALGAGGIKLMGSVDEPAGRVSHTIVENNEIADCTSVFPSAVGILIVHSDHNIVRGNHIHDLEYSGISCGWTWGFGDSATHHNQLLDNHIHDLGTGLLNDMGGIYTLGEQPGTVIRGNHIHHIRADNYGGWAIYADEGSSYILIEKNLLHHTSSECFNLHYGKENILRNNVLAFSGLGVVSVSAAGEDWNSLTLERNILLTDGKPLLVARDGDSLDQNGFRSDLNVLWDAGGKEIFAGDEMRDEFSEVTWDRFTFEQLQQMGYERHSCVADPRFLDAAGGDFQLPADSSAWAIGFQPFSAAETDVRAAEED